MTVGKRYTYILNQFQKHTERVETLGLGTLDLQIGPISAHTRHGNEAASTASGL